jgi:hypothetical protein
MLKVLKAPADILTLRLKYLSQSSKSLYLGLSLIEAGF